MVGAEVLARHVSPDAELAFRVERENGVISLGFEGQGWQMHPDSFEAKGRSSEQIALDVVSERYDTGTDFRILETIEGELELAGTYAPLEFRFWSGRSVDRAELLEGSVDYKPLGQKVATLVTAAAPR